MRDIWYLVLPLIISALITPVVKQIGYRLDAFAQMNERTVHHGKIVRIGGVAIYLAFIITMALYVKTDMAMNGILIGSTIMFIGGLVDDLVNLKPLYKFSFQVVAAIVLIASGVTLDVIRLPLGITINMGVVSFIVTFFWITGITNAVNLIDGLDGLAAGVSTISCVSLVIIALVYSNPGVAILTSALAGGCIGFLPYNRPPAKIFMGDTGSTLLGYVMAVASIQGLFKFYAIISFVIPFFMLGVPIFDTCFAVIRRLRNGESPFKADREHVHYRLMDMGFSKKQTVAVLYGISAILGLTAVVTAASGLSRGLILLVVLGLAVIVMFKGLTRREAEQMEDAPEPEDEPADPERRNGPPSATAP